jgi:hypothetical protein
MVERLDGVFGFLQAGLSELGERSRVFIALRVEFSPKVDVGVGEAVRAVKQ